MSFRFTSLAHTLDFYAHSPDHTKKTAIMHARPGGGYQSLSFFALNEVTKRVASHYRTAFRKQGELPNKTVALYANSSPEYLLTLWGLMQAGFVPLCLSPRNSAAAVSHLASKAEAVVIVRGQESNLATITKELLEDGAIRYAVELISPGELQAIVDSVQAGETRVDDNRLFTEQHPEGLISPDPESVAAMLHSSGSTGAFPKLVRIPQRYTAMLLSISTYVNQPDDVAYALPPFYHAYGFFVACNTLSHGATLVLPAVPSWPPTTQMLVDNIKESKCNVLCLLPWLLETMEADAQQDSSIFELLASMRAVNFSAAALNERTGNVLSARGVRLLNGYGSSEAGVVGTSHYNRTDEPCLHWNHIQIIPEVRCSLVPSGHKHNTYRLVIKKDNPSLALGQSNTPEGDYDMNDLLERAPCRPGRECYIIRGRLDDVIVHSTGEKTSPSPIESTIRAHCTAVKSVVVVGQERFNTGLLAELKPDIEPSEEVLDQVWKAVQVANQSAPQHSRIVRQMIRLIRNGEAGGIPHTDKGTVKRKHVESRFKTQIEELYAAFAGEAGPAGEANREADLTTPEQIAAWLERRLIQLYNNQFPDEKHAGMAHDVSIFSQGFDSLLATQFYYQHLRPAFPDLKLPANLLYQCSDIDHLAARLAAMLQGSAASTAAEGNTVRQAEELYDKYSRRLAEDYQRGEHATAPYQRPAAESVVLTGCTGGLGLFLLDQLLRSPKVERVYALVRAGGRGDVKDKLSKALRAKLLDSALADNEKLRLWGCQLDQPKLGLTDGQWDELVRHSTSVIHNAWLLNFEATPIEFEESCIKPSYELMALCSNQSLKQFMFVSSIAGSLNSVNADGVVEEKLWDSQHRASLMGYGQSKLLTERLATQYAARFGVPVTIARVGQIAGDTVNGTWNTSEHVSLMIKATETLHAMPDHYMRVDALPVDVVAATMTALLTDVHQPDAEDNSGSPNTRVAHIVNPVALPWRDFLAVLQSPDLGLDFRVVEASEWVRLLEESSPDPVANPIKKLQGYFVDLYSAEVAAKSTQAQTEETAAGLEVQFATQHTTELVPSMHYKLDHDFWGKVLQHWRSIGFLQTPSKKQ